MHKFAGRLSAAEAGDELVDSPATGECASFFPDDMIVQRSGRGVPDLPGHDVDLADEELDILDQETIRTDVSTGAETALVTMPFGHGRARV